jgi:hypothetical protein
MDTLVLARQGRCRNPPLGTHKGDPRIQCKNWRLSPPPPPPSLPSPAITSLHRCTKTAPPNFLLCPHRHRCLHCPPLPPPAVLPCRQQQLPSPQNFALNFCGSGGGDGLGDGGGDGSGDGSGGGGGGGIGKGWQGRWRWRCQWGWQWWQQW